jgi:dsRNA-specific ribonuclease
VKGDWKPLWPHQAYPTYNDAPLKILDRLSESGKKKLFTSRSKNPNPRENYEELEWVGDAALELLARRMIYNKYPELKLSEKAVCGGFPS